MNGGISKAFSAGDRRRTKWSELAMGLRTGNRGNGTCHGDDAHLC